jgi:DNA-binding beta-propeller fold protein YncE
MTQTAGRLSLLYVVSILLVAVPKEAEATNPKFWIKSSQLVFSIKAPEVGAVSDIAVDSAGNIHVVDRDSSTIKVYTREANFIREIGKEGSKSERMIQPAGIAVGKNGSIYVADWGDESTAGRILVYDVGTGKLVTEIMVSLPSEEHIRQVRHFRANERPKVTGPALEEGKKIRVRDVAVDREGRIYAVDYAYDRLLSYSKGGSYSFEIGTSGNVPGGLNRPTCVEVSENGEIHVCNTFSGRIEVFDQDGRFVRKYGDNKSFVGGLALPTSIAFDDRDYSIVTDSGGNNIQCFGPREGNPDRWEHKYFLGNDEARMDPMRPPRPLVDWPPPTGIAFDKGTGNVMFGFGGDKGFMVRRLGE